MTERGRREARERIAAMAQARTGRYGNASDYVRDLIRRDQERAHALAELQRLITEGIESGVSNRSVDEVLEIAGQQFARG